MMGNDFQSKQKEDYDNKMDFRDVDGVDQKKLELRKTYLRLGNEQDKWSSQMKDQFIKKPIDYSTSKFNEKQREDLRNAHFELGNFGNNYTSLAKDSFQYDFNQKVVAKKNPKL